MEKKREAGHKRHILSVFWVLALIIIGAAHGLPGAVETAMAEEIHFEKTEANTGLGTGAISPPMVPESADDYWRGSYLWFGNFAYGSERAKFRVLSPPDFRFWWEYHASGLRCSARTEML